ncbi:MAG TPA: NAD(P)H-hydrate dehydratase [Streptosporangiaceae bacterium]|jgi:hydroxyethylthiazole kinase-like uncharacterized protein yjeF
MRNAHTVEKVRSAEHALMAGVPDGALMQRAAAGLAAVCASLLGRVYGARVVVLAGSGDNGGDALFAGERLAGRGARVEAVLTAARHHEEGLAALRRAGGRVTGDLAAIDDADLIIDGMLGIGGRGGLRAEQAEYAERASGAPGTVVAVDLPSGIDADTGRVDGPAVAADVTVTFGTYKPGLFVDPAAGRVGVLERVDIGLGPYLADPDVVAFQGADVARLLPYRAAESDKYRSGVLGLVAGGPVFTGAAVLACGGAVRGGAGMVRFASVAPAVDHVRSAWPEAVTTVVRPGSGKDVLAAGRVQAWAVGPGIGTGEDAAAVLGAVLGTDVPVLVDADGLTVLAENRELLEGRRAPTVLTPHAGELVRLLGDGADRADVEAARLEHVRRAARDLGCVVLLKGSTTLVAEPGGAVRANATGTPRLATAGTGDVLTGLIGALLAGGMAAADAATAGAYLHGLAGRLASEGAPIGAHDVVTALPEAFRSLDG